MLTCSDTLYDRILDASEIQLIFAGLAPELEKNDAENVDIKSLIQEYEDKNKET